MNHAALVQFDLDGTLVDTRDALCTLDIEVVAQFTGKRYSLDEYYKLFDPKADWLKHYKKFGISDPDMQQKALSEFCRLEQALEDINLIPGAMELLDALSVMQIPIHLTTRHENMAIVDNKLARSRLDRYFSHGRVTITDSDKTAAIASVCNSYGIRPSKTFFVTDSANDILCGKRAGVRTIAVYSSASYNSREQLDGARPWLFVEGLAELRKNLINIISCLPYT